MHRKPSNQWSKYLGSNKAENYKKLKENVFKVYKCMEYNISLKIHFGDFHVNLFPPNYRAVYDEHEVRFHQDITFIEKPYQLKWNLSVLADYSYAICH